MFAYKKRIVKDFQLNGDTVISFHLSLCLSKLALVWLKSFAFNLLFKIDLYSIRWTRLGQEHLIVLSN